MKIIHTMKLTPPIRPLIGLLVSLAKHSTVRRFGVSSFFTLCILHAAAQQTLQPGFNLPEYLEVLRITGYINDTSITRENSAMVPSTGQLQINDSTTFQYKLAESPDATVHAAQPRSYYELALRLYGK